jgi:hypothetical protein
LREEIKSGQEEMKSTINAFQEKMDASIANRKNDIKETSCQETTNACLECKEPASGHEGCLEKDDCLPRHNRGQYNED